MYPLSTLMLAGIKDILIISTRESLPSYESLLSDGTDLGITIRYKVQEKPEGIAQAFLLAEEFIEGHNVALILGDNIFHGAGLGTRLSALRDLKGATIFAYKVTDPERYGVVEFSSTGTVLSIEEKPQLPKSSFAIPGLYFFDETVVGIAKEVEKSARGELEITSIIERYLGDKKLSVTVLDRGTAWLDTGTFESLHAASSYVRIVEERQGSKIACLEEIAWRNSWIDSKQLQSLAHRYNGNPYGEYIEQLITEEFY